jgi:hypothetical protein
MSPVETTSTCAHYPAPGQACKSRVGEVPNVTWSPARPELFYATDNGQMMVVSYSIAGDVFNLHPDGVRFAVAGVGEAQKDGAHDHVALIFNFFDELRRIAPPAEK